MGATLAKAARGVNSAAVASRRLSNQTVARSRRSGASGCDPRSTRRQGRWREVAFASAAP